MLRPVLDAAASAPLGVVHVTAVWAPTPEAPLVTLRIGPDTPKSACDFHLLQWSRAMADVIVVTGQVLRDEHALRYELVGPHREALLAARRQPEPPELHVLTSGRGLDPDHPALHGWADALVVAPKGAQLPASVASTTLEGSPADHVRALADGGSTVTIEAGPRTSAGLHDADVVDTVLLAECRAPTLAAALRAGEPLGRATLRERFGHVARTTAEENGVGWEFGLWRRA